ncbi:Adaptor for signal transduction [Pleurotus pulmonarius]|nr:Adaptor for signal transduction [Pleurotus pulmonarius]KAF4586644.1 Adaptor for signal transduction [Pleurotus pulmonarius]
MSETRGLWAQATENEDQALNISLSGRHNDWRDLEVSAQAPTWEVLRIALRNQGIPNRDWKDYVVLIRHGPPENRIEHCLSWDGRPLAKFMKLKNAGKDPAFILKRLESLPSPIVIAQKKIAARTNAGHDDTESVLDIRSLGLGEGTMGQLVDSTTSEEALAHGRPRHGHGFCNSTAADIRSYAVAVYPYIAAQGDEFDVAVYVSLSS